MTAAVPKISIHQAWPALEITLRSVNELIPYIRNPRAHSPAQVQQIAASMREFGWVNPVLVDEDSTVLAGHGRLQAALLLKWEEAPVMVARGWSEAKKRAYVIADNKLALNASWDITLLDSEIRALRDEDFDVDLLGFSDTELKRLGDDVAELAFDGQGGTEPGAPRNAAGDENTQMASDQVAFTVPVTVGQRDLIFRAVTAAKQRHSLELSGIALWTICKEYLERR